VGSNPALRIPLPHGHAPSPLRADSRADGGPEHHPPLPTWTSRPSVGSRWPSCSVTAEDLGLTPPPGSRGQELIVLIERALLARGEELTAEGTLELVPEGHGFLRSADYSYLASPDDIYVSQTQVRRFGVKTGDTIRGRVRPPKHWEKFLALLQVESVNGGAPELIQGRVAFDALRPRYPDQRIRLESSSADSRCASPISSHRSAKGSAA
jgi:transcription termination factor Rho